MLRRFEAWLNPTARPPEEPPSTDNPRDGAGLWRFYWHFIRQERWLAIGLFCCGGLIAILDAAIPAFIGRVVVAGLHPCAGDAAGTTPGRSSRSWRRCCCWRGPACSCSYATLINQIVNPGFTNMIRWQNHWHVVRQSWTFFQNDFAGRIANRVMQTGPALRESVVMTFDAAWYIVVYGSSALLLLVSIDWRLTPPIFALVRRLRADAALRSCRGCASARAAVSEMRSQLTGRVVDSYTNILTVKLFARAARRGRLRARRDRRAHRRLPRPDADDHRLYR